MMLSLDEIKDKELEKVGIVLGLGPSLNQVLPVAEKMSEENRDDVSFYTCNLFNSMTSIETDYWVVCNSQEIMTLKKAFGRYNSQPDSTFVFTPRIIGFSLEDANSLLKGKYLPIHDMPGEATSLSDYLKEYTNSEQGYPPVYSVIIHQIALAIVTGCKEIYISGVDLDYSKGYAKRDVHSDGERLGKMYMNSEARARTISQIQFLRACAKNVGCEIYSLNETGPLSQILDIKKIDELKIKLDENSSNRR
jgi:hypothetical protein